MRRRIVALLSVITLAISVVAPAAETMADTGFTVTGTDPISASPTGELGNMGGASAVSSSDGRYIAYFSASSNILPDVTLPVSPSGNVNGQAFFHDQQTNTTEIVSLSNSGEMVQTDNPYYATGAFPLSVSDNGRYILFQSSATNLAPGYPPSHPTCPNCGFDGVYLRDRQAGTTTLINTPTLYGANSLPHASMSGDGNIIAYTGTVSMSLGAPQRQVYVYNRTTNETITLPSTLYATVSHDGHYAIYWSGGYLYRYDLATSESTPLVAGSSLAGILSQDNTKLGYYGISGSEVKVLDIPTGNITVVSSGVPSGFTQGSLSFSANGRFLSYFTRRSDPFHSGEARVVDLSNNQSSTIVTLSNQGSNLQLNNDATQLIYTPHTNGTDGGPTQVYLAHLVPPPDTTAPTVTGTPDREPNTNGWYNNNVTITWHATDDSGTPSQPAPTIASTQGSNVTYTSDQSCDAANNCATGSLDLSIDKTAPTATGATATPGLILFTGTLSISASASDSLSGVVGGEYYIDTDPGQGNGSAMTYNSGTGKITATKNLTTGSLSPGLHRVWMRSQDAAGNWSTLVSKTFIYV